MAPIMGIDKSTPQAPDQQGLIRETSMKSMYLVLVISVCNSENSWLAGLSAIQYKV
jgi:hypothetical protein